MIYFKWVQGMGARTFSKSNLSGDAGSKLDLGFLRSSLNEAKLACNKPCGLFHMVFSAFLGTQG